MGKLPKQRTFFIREDVATLHSLFFAATVRHRWKEGEERIIRLEEDGAEHFEIFGRFIHRGKIYSQKPGDRASDLADEEWLRLAGCWVLSDKLKSTSFKDAIVDAMCEKLKEDKRYPTELHQVIYPASGQHAAIRRLLIDVAVWDWGNDDVKACDMQEAWNDFFQDYIIRLRELSEVSRKGPKPYSDAACKYHEHTQAGLHCYKTMFQ